MQRQRNVVGTTLLVLLTVFVIAPILLIVGCGVLFGSGSGTSHTEPPGQSNPNPYQWPSGAPS